MNCSTLRSFEDVIIIYAVMRVSVAARWIVKITCEVTKIGLLFAGFLLAIPALPQAHEFWIEPSSFQPETNQILTADLLIGTDYLGSSGIYVPDQIEAFAFLRPKAAGPAGNHSDDQIERQEISGRYGDRPAGKFNSGAAGLGIILHQTAPIRMVYSSTTKFDDFAREKGFDQAFEQHQRLGLALDKITERYQRFAKSLINVGEPVTAGAGIDRHLGLAIELVAEKNPYQLPPLETMPIRLYASGKPLANAQITVFTRHNPRDVEVAKYRTDQAGRAHFAVLAGRDYLVDSVILRPLPEADVGDAMWESLWASLTFQIPAKK